jgi:formamidopyrimidine-DNA glycosylase
VLDIGLAAFAERLAAENHTLKRALTDPRLFSGIGNAYSDEILHRAACRRWRSRRSWRTPASRGCTTPYATLKEWIERLRADTGTDFPEKVTAFHRQMAVHGRYQQPCPVCGAPVQRIRYADNETNYCARCQTGGRLLADRAMSRLLREDWPRSIVSRRMFPQLSRPAAAARARSRGVPTRPATRSRWWGTAHRSCCPGTAYGRSAR